MSDKAIPNLLTDSQLIHLDDDDRLDYLKRSWGYNPSDILEVFGVIKRSDGGEFYVLDNLRNSKFLRIIYPISGFSGRNTIFIGAALNNECDEGDLVIARVKLSPMAERTKHNNVLELNAIASSMRQILRLPDEILIQSSENSEGYVEKWIVDYIARSRSEDIYQAAEKIKKELTEDELKIRLSLSGLQGELEGAEDALKENQVHIEQQRDLIHQGSSEIEEKKSALIKIEHDLKMIKESKGNIVNELNGFIEKKARLLQELGIVDEETLKNLTDSFNDPTLPQDSYNFSDFDNPRKAIAHIQAYLYKKGILYRREVLENFFALLSTRDLIILAGDSGSGKTNLVKSFSEAVGGKCFVIPVKPNWTSSEDLLGYYNPIEQSYLSTPFLDALLEARQNPQVPHFICLDEMNLARVEYYFADFLSLLEERDYQPSIHLYSQSESSHLVSETKNFLALLEEAKVGLGKDDLQSFFEILQDAELNRKLHELCGFKDGSSLLTYHTKLRKAFASYLNNPAALQIPGNVFFVGAINVDETTNYLSPKILDRAHIVRFTNPLLQDWDAIKTEVEEYGDDFDVSKPAFFPVDRFGVREAYPAFDENSEIEAWLVQVTKAYLLPLGIDFGLRSIRQAKNYYQKYHYHFGIDLELALNNIVRQKILPKLMFDGTKKIDKTREKKDVLQDFRTHLSREFSKIEHNDEHTAINELSMTLTNAEMNDWMVNYWSR